MKINEVMKGLMVIIRPLSKDDQGIFLMVYIRMLLRDSSLPLASEKLEDLKNALKYYFDGEFGRDTERLAEAFLRSNI